MAHQIGPLYPQTATDLMDGGSKSGGAATWSNPSLIEAFDGNNTYCYVDAGGYFDTLVGSNFGTTIPAAAKITGILVEINRNGYAVADGGVFVGNSTKTGSPKTGAWPSSAGWVQFGGQGDTWGQNWTGADINQVSFGISMQAYNTHGGSQINVDAYRLTVWYSDAPADVPKRYIYKVYDGVSGAYLGDIPNVLSEFTISQEINTGGAQITIQAAITADTSIQPSSGQILDETGAPITDETGDPFVSEGAVSPVGLGAGSSALIKNGNQIVVYEVGYYYPNGRVAFLGEMERWEATYGGDAQDNTVSILCYSHGSDLDNFLVTGSPYVYTADQQQTAQNHSESISSQSGDKFSGYNFYGQSFTVGGSGSTNVGGIALLLNGAANVTVTLYDTPAMLNVMAVSTVNVNTGGGAQEVLFGFANHWITNGGTQPFFTVTVDANQSITIYDNSSNPYAGGQAYNANYGGGSGGGSYGPLTGYDLYFKTYSTSGSTTATFSNQDPSTGMLASIMGDYRSRGGTILSGGNTIDATGLSLTYQFNTNTVYEAIEAMLTIAPYGFYYYVDLGTDTLYFKKASLTADVILTKGIHINKLTVVGTIENISNSIYFTGGETSAGPPPVNLYKSYQNAASIARYGQRLDRRSDNRVLTTAAADAIGTSALAEEKDEQYQTVVTVIDKTMDTSTLRPGLVIGFRGFGTFVDTMLAMIVRVDYTPEAVTLTLGYLPPRLSTDVEQVTRDLLAQQTIDNPSSPS